AAGAEGVPEQGRAAVPVDGDDLRSDRVDREIRAGAWLARDRERELRSGRYLTEVLDEPEDRLVADDRVREPVAKARTASKDLVEPREPRPALLRGAAGEVREIDGGSGYRQL